MPYTVNIPDPSLRKKYERELFSLQVLAEHAKALYPDSSERDKIYEEYLRKTGLIDYATYVPPPEKPKSFGEEFMGGVSRGQLERPVNPITNKYIEPPKTFAGKLGEAVGEIGKAASKVPGFLKENLYDPANILANFTAKYYFGPMGGKFPRVTWEEFKNDLESLAVPANAAINIYMLATLGQAAANTVQLVKKVPLATTVKTTTITEKPTAVQREMAQAILKDPAKLEEVRKMAQNLAEEAGNPAAAEQIYQTQQRIIRAAAENRPITRTIVTDVQHQSFLKGILGRVNLKYGPVLKGAPKKGEVLNATVGEPEAIPKKLSAPQPEWAEATVVGPEPIKGPPGQPRLPSPVGVPSADELALAKKSATEGEFIRAVLRQNNGQLPKPQEHYIRVWQEAKAKPIPKDVLRVQKTAEQLAAEKEALNLELEKATTHPQTGLKTTQPINPQNIKQGTVAVLDVSNLGLVNTTVAGPGAEVLKSRFGTLGHAAGDAYLREYGNAVRKGIEGTDVVAWIGKGSDEVKLYSPTLSKPEMDAVIDKIQSYMGEVTSFEGIDKSNKQTIGQLGLIRTAGAVEIKGKGYDKAMEEAGKIEKRKLAEPVAPETATEPIPGGVQENIPEPQPITPGPEEARGIKTEPPEAPGRQPTGQEAFTELYSGLPLKKILNLVTELDKAWIKSPVYKGIVKALYEEPGLESKLERGLPPDWWKFKPIQRITIFAKLFDPDYNLTPAEIQAKENFKGWLGENSEKIKNHIDKLNKLKPEEVREFRRIIESGEYEKMNTPLAGLAKENQELFNGWYKNAIELNLAKESEYQGVYFPHLYKLFEGKKLSPQDRAAIKTLVGLQNEPEKLNQVLSMIETGKFTTDKLGKTARHFVELSKKTGVELKPRTPAGMKIGPKDWAKERRIYDVQLQRLFQIIDDSPAPIAKRMVQIVRDVGVARYLREISNLPTAAVDVSAARLAKEVKMQLGPNYHPGLSAEEYRDLIKASGVHCPPNKIDKITTFLATDEYPTTIPEGFTLVEGKQYGELNGMAVKNELLENEIKPLVQLKSSADRFFERLNNYYKFVKVPANLPTSMRNLYTNTYSAWMLGDVPLGELPSLFGEALNIIRNKGPHYDNLIKHNVFQSKWSAQELRGIEEAIPSENPVASVINWVDNKVVKPVAEKYSLAEDLFKTIVYLNGVKNGMPPADAAYMAHYSIGDYSKATALINQLSRGTAHGPLGSVGPIVQSPFTKWRYLFLGRYAHSLLRAPFRNLTVALTGYLMYSNLRRALTDMFGSEEKAVKKIKQGLAYWARRGKVVTPMPGFRKDPDTGEPIVDYLDLTFLSPFGDIGETSVRSSRGEFQRAFIESWGLGGNPLLNILQLYKTGRNTYLDREIYDILDKPEDVQLKLAKESFRQLAPSMFGYNLPHLAQAAFGKQGTLGERRSVLREVLSLFGLKSVPFSESMLRTETIMEIKDLQKAYLRRVYKMAREGKSDEDIEKVTKEYRKRIEEIYERSK